MAATLLEITELPIRDIDTEGRLRPINEASVISLMASIEEIGLQSEIHVRRIRHQGGRLRLIAGGHRLEALSRLGCTSVAAKVWDCTDDWALMSEIDDNLAHADLGALDLSVFLAERKTVYERMYPEAKNGGNRGNQHTGGWQNDIMSFCQSVAEQKDMSKRQIERLVSAGQALDRSAIEQLRRAPQKVTLADLQTIAKCTNSSDRQLICTALSNGTAKSAKAALDAKSAKPGDAKQSPADQQAKALKDAWARASMSARRQFVEDHFEALEKLLVHGAGPAEIVTFKARDREAS